MDCRGDMETGGKRETGLGIFIVSGKCDLKKRTMCLYRPKKSDDKQKISTVLDQ